MVQSRKVHPLVWMVIGLVAGVSIGGFWPHSPLHATATDRYETFAVATGFVDDGIEAVYFLDFLTGDLRAAVLSKQMPMRFNAFFQRNILTDLGVDPSKNPRYLMVTGMTDTPRGGGQARLSSSVVYVAEITTGQVAAYAIPWNSAQHSAGQVTNGVLMPMATTRFRTAVVREQK
ncbi:MAG: hypothetical protein NTW96_18785 [Planctomycetia bacterium]|nr:hypothetical protein [Planctomycetia bacterium]